MKCKIALLVAVLVFASSANAQHPSGYAYRPVLCFPPGLYEAVVDAKVYYEIAPPEAEEGVVVKKGTRLSVYSAGDVIGGESITWLDLGSFDSPELKCNLAPAPKLKAVLPAPFVRAKDFRRVGSLAPLTYETRRNIRCGALDDPLNDNYNAAALEVVRLGCGITKGVTKIAMKSAGAPKVLPTNDGTSKYLWLSAPRKDGASVIQCGVYLLFSDDSEDGRLRSARVACVTKGGPDSWGEAKRSQDDLYSRECP